MVSQLGDVQFKISLNNGNILFSQWSNQPPSAYRGHNAKQGCVWGPDDVVSWDDPALIIKTFGEVERVEGQSDSAWKGLCFNIYILNKWCPLSSYTHSFMYHSGNCPHRNHKNMPHSVCSLLSSELFKTRWKTKLRIIYIYYQLALVKCTIFPASVLLPSGNVRGTPSPSPSLSLWSTFLFASPYLTLKISTLLIFLFSEHLIFKFHIVFS